MRPAVTERLRGERSSLCAGTGAPIAPDRRHPAKAENWSSIIERRVPRRPSSLRKLSLVKTSAASLVVTTPYERRRTKAASLSRK